jgi:transcriptional regulator with XRE-family HTH domain
MIEFHKEQLENFLAVMRKYMQLRGGLSQKDVAELTGTGISTMSRFLTQKTTTLDAQLIAKLVAKLDIPLHEVIDFISEDSTMKFKKLVQFYKEDETADKTSSEADAESEESGDQGFAQADFEDSMADIFETDKRTVAKVKVGGRTTSIPFGGDERRRNSDFRDKLQGLSLKQKAFVSDFLDVDNAGRDLIVDVGNQLLSYFKQRGVQF